MEHIISQHNVTLVASAGNDSYANVLLPALLHNAIGVGAFHNNNDVMRGSLYPRDMGGSGYINANGVKKPDVILTNDIGGGATSSSAPVLTAMIAQLIELKPSLAIQPELIKSIVLASCHRKVLPSPVNEPQEYITDGITERQGAGIADLWTMVCIVTQGTYSLGTLQERDSKINIFQPAYGAEYMNVSVSWLKDNKFDSIYNQVSAAHNINIGEVTNIDLYVSNSNSQLASSTLANSSTEMCYFSLSDNSSFYTIELRQPPEKINVDYAVAWSTDDMYVTDMDTDGIYMIRNFTDDSLLKYNETSNTVNLVQNSSNTQLDSSYMWLYKDNGNNNIDLMVGNSITDKYITNAGGTVMITYSSSGLIPYYNSDYNNGYSFRSGTYYLQKGTNGAVWSHPGNNTYWYLDRVNYQKGDLDMNGSISIADTIILQQILSRIISGNQIQKHLGDINNNGVIDIGDATLISQILSRY